MGVTIDADFTGGNNYRQSAPPADDQTTIDRRYLELVSQIVDRDGLRNIKPPAALVNDYLYLNSLVWIGGKPGHGKSFVAIELACCVATGTPWHEHPVQKGRVLYLIAEGASGISDRVDAWERANNQRPPSTELLFLPIPIHMMQPVDVAAMKQILAEITPTLVILTRRHASPLVQTKTRRDMGAFVEALETLRRASNACILVVHHEPRGGDNLRGSTAVEGAATTILRASKDGDLVTISNPKQKDAPEIENLELVLEPRGDSAVLVRKGMAQQGKLTAAAKHILEVISEFEPNGVATTVLKQSCAVQIPVPATFYRNLRSLVNKGLVDEVPSGNSNKYHMGRVDPEVWQ